MCIWQWNEWSWVGRSSMQVSGWNRLVSRLRFSCSAPKRNVTDLPSQVQSFENTHVPLFFSEYGTTSGESNPRQFHETTAIYSPEMTRIFSGACAYEFFEGPNRYGLVVVRADGTLEKLRAYDNFQARLAESRKVEDPGTLGEWEGSELVESNRPELPAQTYDWRASSELPECPLDWEEVRTQIEDRQWIDVAEEVERSLVLSEPDLL